MMEDKILCDNEWLQLKEMKCPEHDIHGYVYSHEVRCNGYIVSVLPFRTTNERFEFLLRKEVTPCWHPTIQMISSITGGYEPEKRLDGTAVDELREEGGYTVTKRDMIYLGWSFGTKSTDTVYHMFTANLTDKERGEATGDGSAMEEKAECFWGTYKDIQQAVDPFVYVCYMKFINLNKDAFGK